MGALIEVIAPVFILIGVGYLAVWRGVFSATGADALMRFAQTIAIPFLLFRAISTLDLSAGFDPRLLASFYTGSTVNFALGMLGARYLFGRPWQDSVAIGFAALFANTVLLGLPIMERAFGADALAPNYAIIAFHAAFCYLLGMTTMEVVKSGGGGLGHIVRTVSSAMFHNALMIGIAAGLIANIVGLRLPIPVTAALDLMAASALPVALFALGGVLSRYRSEGETRIVIWVSGLSLFVHPAVALFMSVWVFDLPQTLVRGAVLTASMAPGVNSYIFAHMYGRATRIAASVVLVGTALSIVSVSFWLWVLGA